MLSKLPGTQDVPRKEQREIPDFFSSPRRTEKKGFCKRVIIDRKEPRHKVLLFFSIRMPPQ